MLKEKTNVPVIMYHSIGKPNKKWRFNHLTCPYGLFESQLMWMKKKNFHSISLQQLYDYVNKGIKLPKNPVVLTFDDGYLDNWVFAYPLLKKYGFNGTIYANPDFVDPRNICRKTLEDVWDGELEIEKLETTGYLSWKEMKEMVEERVMDIQSHAMTHTWYFKSNKIVDFRHPGDPYIWITWNNNTEKKPYLQIDKNELIDYGEPVYEYGKSLEIKRYFPDEGLSKYLITYVKEKGVEDFFKTIDWKDKLLRIFKTYKNENILDERLETEKEYEKRIKYELERAKKIIEQKLRKNVKFLCMPGGGVTKKALEIAFEVGYISTTAPKNIKNDENYKMKNTHSLDLSQIYRVGPVLYWNGIVGYNNKIRYKNGFLFGLSLYNFQGKKIITIINKIVLRGTRNLYKSIFFVKR